MASLVSGIFDLASGDPTEGEEKKLGALGNYDTATGEALTTAGAGFDESILSGDLSRMATTLAPEISGQQSQIEQQRLQDANFNTRSGGTAASTSAAEAAGRGNIISLEGGLQSGAASSALASGSNLLSQATPNITDEASLLNQRRQQANQDVGGIAQGAAEIAEGAFTGSPTPPPPTSPEQLTNLDQGAPPPDLTYDQSSGLSPQSLDLSAFQ